MTSGDDKSDSTRYRIDEILPPARQYLIEEWDRRTWAGRLTLPGEILLVPILRVASKIRSRLPKTYESTPDYLTNDLVKRETMSEEQEHDYENELPVNETIAQLVYDELGHQVDKIDDVLYRYQENDLEHTPSYEALRKRGACFRTMRGALQQMGDWNLR